MIHITHFCTGNRKQGVLAHWLPRHKPEIMNNVPKAGYTFLHDECKSSGEVFVRSVFR